MKYQSITTLFLPYLVFTASSLNWLELRVVCTVRQFHSRAAYPAAHEINHRLKLAMALTMSSSRRTKSRAIRPGDDGQLSAGPPYRSLARNLLTFCHGFPCWEIVFNYLCERGHRQFLLTPVAIDAAVFGQRGRSEERTESSVCWSRHIQVVQKLTRIWENFLLQICRAFCYYSVNRR